MVVLHDLEVGGGARCICQGCWGRFFWLVHPRHGDQGNLVIGVERPDADVLVIWFVVRCGSDADDANGRGVGGVEGACRDSLLYEQWATTRDLSWMRLMKRRMCVRAMRSKLRRTKARMWEGSSVVGVDKRIV